MLALGFKCLCLFHWFSSVLIFQSLTFLKPRHKGVPRHQGMSPSERERDKKSRRHRKRDEMDFEAQEELMRLFQACTSLGSIVVVSSHDPGKSNSQQTSERSLPL